MPRELNDPLLISAANVTLLVSTMLCLVLMVARSRGPLLEFRPRRPVPWNGVGALLAPFLVLLGIVAAITPADSPTTPPTSEKAAKTSAESNKGLHDSEDEPQVHESALKLLLGAIQETVVVGGVVIMIALYFKVTPADLGVATGFPILARNIFIGIVVGIASLAPVRLIQGWLMYLAGKQDLDSGHPLVKALQEAPPGIMTMLAASLMAVLVAPICEEITFRLLLQGWLEKWEYLKTRDSVTTTLAEEPSHAFIQVVAEKQADEIDPIEVALESSSTVIDSPPKHGVAGLPFGLVPITASSLLFGIAHFGYGPEPIPLSLLAVMLGYVYYRTHSIVPSIVAHALFNSFTMLALWRLWFIGGT